MAGKYFEDFKNGDVFETGGVTVTRSQIIDFALLYDPQPFQIDVVAANDSPFGGLVASGYQVMALTNRLFAGTALLAGTGLGATAAEEVHWLKPVRAGDTLSVRAEVIEITPARARTDRGFVRIRFTTGNQNREAVMTMNVNYVVSRRADVSA